MSETESVGKLFRSFFEADDLPDIVSSFGSVCRKVEVNPDQYEDFYPSLREKLHDWRCDPLWDILDARVSIPVYQKQSICRGKRLLIIGAGPVGLRAAVEGALLGAHVDVVEKRNTFTRNNVVHLLPFVVQDLKGIGVKHFYSKFCCSSISHISKYIMLLDVCTFSCMGIIL